MDPNAKWQGKAKCLGVGVGKFFPDDRKTPEAQKALKYCAACSVKRECLEYGKENSLSGIWGGRLLAPKIDFSVDVTAYPDYDDIMEEDMESEIPIGETMRMFSVKEAAEHLGASEHMVLKWMREDGLTPVKTIGRVYIFDEVTLDTFKPTPGKRRGREGRGVPTKGVSFNFEAGLVDKIKAEATELGVSLRVFVESILSDENLRKMGAPASSKKPKAIPDAVFSHQ